MSDGFLKAFSRKKREGKCYLKLSKANRRREGGGIKSWERERTLFSVSVRFLVLGSVGGRVPDKPSLSSVEHIYMVPSFIVSFVKGLWTDPPRRAVKRKTLLRERPLLCASRNDFVNWTWCIANGLNWKRVLNANGWQSHSVFLLFSLVYIFSFQQCSLFFFPSS